MANTLWLKITLLLLLLQAVAFAAFAQKLDYSIDYDALFLLHADRVAEAEDGNAATLEMPGEILLRRLGPPESHRYTGTDLSGKGAVGCVMMLMTEVETFVTACPELVPASQKTKLDGVFAKVSAFYAANTYPAVPLDEFSNWQHNRIENMARERKTNFPLNCSQSADILVFVEHLTSDELGVEMEDMLTVPRLPVNSPCL